MRFFLLSILFMSVSVYAQDVEQLANQVKDLKNVPDQLLKKGITASGSIWANTNFFQARELMPGQRPVEGNINGSMNFDILGKVQMPFSFSWNTRSMNYAHPFDRRYRLQQPFNRYQLRPTYKGFSLLIGVNSLTFSEYVLNGYRFEGIGFSFKNPKVPVYASFLHGNLNKPIYPDSLLTSGLSSAIRPALLRRGTGFQIGTRIKQQTFEISFLKGRDRLATELETFYPAPKENVSFGAKTELTLFKNISLKADASVSGVTEDIRSPLESMNDGAFDFLGLLNTNSSSQLYRALKSGINYSGKIFNVGLEYNYIDPNYSSMGIYYVADDLQNLAGNVATQLMEGKLMLMASLGRQGSTSRTEQTMPMNQWVGSFNATYAPSERFTGTLVYSNFTSFSNMRSDLEYLTSVVPFSALDTLNYRQVNQNLMGNASVMLGPESEEVQNALNLSLMYQDTEGMIGDERSEQSSIANLNLMYTHTGQKTGWQYGGGLNVSRNDFLFMKDWLYGPTATLGKSFEGFTSALQCSYLLTSRSDNQNSGVMNLGLNLSYTLKEKHTLGLNALFLDRRVKNSEFDMDTWNLTAALSYRYNFNVFKLSKK
jgi:hypothetical protein